MSFNTYIRRLIKSTYSQQYVYTWSVSLRIEVLCKISFLHIAFENYKDDYFRTSFLF